MLCNRSLASLNASAAHRSVPCSRAPGRSFERAVVWQRFATDEGDAGPTRDDIESAFSRELRKRGIGSVDDLDVKGDATSGRPVSKPPPSWASTSRPTSPFQPQETAQEAQTRTRPRAPPPPMVEGQRERSMALVNEGLEGLFPRASQLLQLGFSTFLPFLPFMLGFSLVFTLIFMVFGDSFLHGGRTGAGLPEYMDPQTLLSQPTVDPYVPFQR